MSNLFIRAEKCGGATVISDSSFTAPIKIAKPFYRDNYTEIMMMTASAGLLEGDCYDTEIIAAEISCLKFTGQSYTKIFKADKTGAVQNTAITVNSGAKMFYMPCPVIPFADSVYSACTNIHLASDCRFAMCDIVSCGRAAMNEKFLFRRYRSRTSVYVDGRMVFLDNVLFLPDEADLSATGFFEGYTHAGMIYIYGFGIDSLPEINGLEAAVTRAEAGICIRAAADSADDIARLAQLVTADFFNG